MKPKDAVLNNKMVISNDTIRAGCLECILMTRVTPNPRRVVRRQPAYDTGLLQQLEALHQTGLELLEERDFARLTSRIIERARKLVGGDGAALFLARADGSLEMVAAINPPLSGVGTILPPGKGVTGWVIEHRESLLVNDYLAWPHHSRLLHNEPNRSFMAVPLMVAGVVHGALSVSVENRTDAFTRDHLRILERFAALVTVALENGRLFEALERTQAEAEQRLHSIEAFNRISLALTENREPTQLIARVLEASCQLTRAEVASFWQTNAEGNALELAAIHGEPMPQEPAYLAFGEGAAGQVALRGQPVLVNDYQAWEHRNPSFDGSRNRAVIAVPLGRGQVPLGVLTVINNTATNSFNNDDLEVLRRFAAPVTVSLEAAHLYEAARRAESQARRRNDLLEALHEISLEVAGQLEPGRLLRSILERAAALFDADAGAIFLYDTPNETPDTARLVASLGTKAGSTIKLGRGVAGLVIQTGEAMLVSDYQRFAGRVRSGRSTWRSVMTVPLRHSTNVLGSLGVADTRQPGRFTSDDLHALERLASLAAVALENARLYVAEHQKLRDERLHARISAAIARLQSVPELCAAVMRELFEVLGYLHVSIYLIQDGELHMQSQIGYETPYLIIPLESGVHGRVARTAQPVLIREAAKEPEFMRAAPNLNSQVCVPLVGRNGVFGTISVESDGRPPLDTHDLEMILKVAATVSVALENAFLHQEARRRASELEWLKREAEYTARHDALTALPNRRAFEADIQAALKRAQLLEQPFTLGAIDLVGFKAVNDRLGHEMGDTALRRVAAEMMASKVATYRVGGDEFALLIHTDYVRALEIVSQIAQQIERIEFAPGVQVGLNIGLAEYPTDTTDLDRLQNLADTRMYLAKRAGRAVLGRKELSEPPAPRRRRSDQ
jgi:diguanylate cyclase (GGDEF)-like protein